MALSVNTRWMGVPIPARYVMTAPRTTRCCAGKVKCPRQRSRDRVARRRTRLPVVLETPKFEAMSAGEEELASQLYDGLRHMGCDAGRGCRDPKTHRAASLHHRPGVGPATCGIRLAHQVLVARDVATLKPHDGEFIADKFEAVSVMRDYAEGWGGGVAHGRAMDLDAANTHGPSARRVRWCWTRLSQQLARADRLCCLPPTA